MEHFRDVLVPIACFTIVAFASGQLGRFFVKAKLPLITGFLFTGILVGPHVLGMIPSGAAEKLRFVDQAALAFIAFTAGNHLYLKELAFRLKSIAWVTTGVVAIAFSLGSLALFLLAAYVPFMQSMPTAHRVAVSLLGGVILVARSPASAIAIVKELRARGPFTQTVVGVTVIVDGVVIVLFAVNSSLADGLLTDLRFNLGFLLLLASELLLSLAIAYLLARFLQFTLSLRVGSFTKTGMILAAGYGVFVLASGVREFSHQHWRWDVFFEPLLTCMAASFLVANFSKHRRELLRILHRAGPPVYVAFFTLTGASLAMDVLAETWAIALALFLARLVVLFLGSFVGGVLAGDPMRHNRISWMCHVTQAGIGLGLAKEVAVEFPDWGTAFATLMISVIVLNQILGPPLFRWAIAMAGESHVRADTPLAARGRTALLFGLHEESIALARQLRLHEWRVTIASTADTPDDKLATADLDVQSISDLTRDTLRQVGAAEASTIVAMLGDEENFRICELAYEHFGTENLVVRLNNRTLLERFEGLGALVVDSTTAMISLLDHSVRSPSATSLLLGVEEDQDIVDIAVRNPVFRDMPLRDVRMPLDTLVLMVRRGGQRLISHGDTRLKVGDRITVVGSVQSLDELRWRFAEPSPESGYGPAKKEIDASGLLVKDVMRSDPQTIPERATFDQVLQTLDQGEHAILPVISPEGLLRGLISFQEIQDILFDEGLSNLVIASDLAHEDVPTLLPEDPLEQAMSLFHDSGIGSLPVVDPQNPRLLVGLLEQRLVVRIYHEKGRGGTAGS
ncbi:MAG: cation:proton antiporter [Pirellulales bacterium]|nr:cation:proton antiporter [Pirellulales bacterium]